ncbi:phage antirepressor N-terminal domain-containing protein [Yersinia enterocolitica]|uniref:phage antirepressor N-terminal domain-containing protein n=1 Tax=Yersinia intermedia TaxID=631 RepID=UPI0011A83177|nr:phage antirepressor N-terminal domain-containing protein [Yersinia intermedia]
MTSIAIIEAVNTTEVQFHGQPIITAMVAGVAYVAMKPIVENLGLSWASQHRKLMNSGDKYGYAHMSIPSKGGIQEMLCLPLRKLNGWLFSINPEKVRADIRDKLIQYQEECFAVLHEYWTKGEVSKKTKTRQSTATQLTPLRQTAERLIATGLGKIYPDIWKLVHSRFDIEHIHQLQPHQVGEAIEFLNAIEGEFLGKQNNAPEPVATNHRYLVCVRIKDEITGGKVELNISAETFASMVTGISTCLGYEPIGFNKVPAAKHLIKQIH